MAKKFYAVQRGRTPGIYVTWGDCEKQVKGYAGAIFKSFPTMQEAEAFMTGGSVSMSLADYFGSPKEAEERRILSRGVPTSRKSIGESISDKTGKEEVAPSTETILTAYIDGSFDKRTGAVGAGGIIFRGNEEAEFSFGTRESLYTAYWNVAGELLAARHVIEEALAGGYDECHIYYDYMGIEMWATGRWKANNPLTQSYAAFCKAAANNVKLVFHKVAAHTGVAYNERADSLAKAGTKKV